MNELNLAITRLQASANAIIAKLDSAGTTNDAALATATTAINAVSDQLDGKSV